MAVTISDVESLSSKSWQHLDDAKKQSLLDIAKSEKDTIYSGRVSTMPTLEGDEDDFVCWLAAHKFELAQGGEATSEGEVSYNTVTGSERDTLTQTRYGREALKYLREEQSIGIVRTR